MPPLVQKDRGDDFELLPEHWDAWQVFLSCATQWRVLVGMGSVRYQGLDYGGVESVMRLRGVKEEDRGELFAQLQVLEEEALKVINGKSSG